MALPRDARRDIDKIRQAIGLVREAKRGNPEV